MALALFWLRSALFTAPFSCAQNPAAAPATTASRDSAAQDHSAEALYLQLQTVGLDKSRVYNIREVTLERAAFHITFDDGTIAFTEDVAGHVTGAFFEGEGEVLLIPNEPGGAGLHDAFHRGRHPGRKICHRIFSL